MAVTVIYMQWQEVCEDQNLKNLPFKIELNYQGKVLMTPVKVNHSILQGKIIGNISSSSLSRLVRSAGVDRERRLQAVCDRKQLKFD